MASSSVAATPETEQRGFDPSPWGDFFITYEPPPLQRSEEWMITRAEELKGNVQELFKTCSSTSVKMFLVDTIQHLGIHHHFQDEIDAALGEILESEFSVGSSSLNEVALRFRLLREHGHWVSPAHLLIHGESTLEEAMTFARQHLESMRGCLKPPLDKQVKRALHRPLPRSCKRVETLRYISEYGEEEGNNTTLLELAKLDFNLLQHVYLKELKSTTEWWKHLSGYIDLSFIRDRLVESYTWAYVLYYEKDSELPRSILTKMIVLITTLDDVYDIRATLEESQKLHEAIQSWDESAVSLVPEYLQKLYKELLMTFKNIEDEIPININYDIAHLKKSIQNHVTGYLQEAKWSHRNYKPSFKDQVDLTCLTIGAPTVCTSMMVGMGEQIMKQALEWTAGVPNVVVAAGKVVRLMNDIAAFEHRKCKGDTASSVECYINEHNVTGEVAIARIDTLLEYQWRTLNQARFENRPLLPALERIIGLALSATFFYDNRNDVYTLSTHLRKTIESLFVKPI
ncbi:hypothetical protein ACQ4PT_028586 [Festuca glaucescens]